jgi:hypothetical protein
MSALLGTYQQWRGRSNLCRALIWAQCAPSLHDFARNKGKICDENCLQILQTDTNEDFDLR